MQDNLLKADEAERVFFQNASHELRTPLMSISGYAQGIQRGVFEDTSQAAGVILDESSRLTEVVDGILTLTRMDQMRYQVVPVELGIREYIEDQIERLEGLAYQKKIKLEFLPGDEHKIISDVMLLGRAFSNVTSNCIRYAKGDGSDFCGRVGDQLKLTIRDDGPGIAENDLPHLFDRFYKGKNGNHGLGAFHREAFHGIYGRRYRGRKLAGRCRVHDHTAAGLPQLCRRRMDGSVIRW